MTDRWAEDCGSPLLYEGDNAGMILPLKYGMLNRYPGGRGESNHEP